MKLFQRLLVAPAAIGLLSPLASNATEVDLNEISNFSEVENVEIVNLFNKEVKENKLIAGERAAGLIPPTEQEMQMAQMAMDSQNSGGNLGKPINEPEIDTSKTEDPDSPGTPDLKGGEI